MKIKYYVDILGTIWLPRVQAAQSMTISAKDLERAGYSLPLTHDTHEIEHYIDRHCGDFASIDALRITKLERETLPSVYDEINDLGTAPWTQHTTRERVTILRDFTEDEELAWNDCMYGVMG